MVKLIFFFLFYIQDDTVTIKHLTAQILKQI